MRAAVARGQVDGEHTPRAITHLFHQICSRGLQPAFGQGEMRHFAAAHQPAGPLLQCGGPVHKDGNWGSGNLSWHDEQKSAITSDVITAVTIRSRPVDGKSGLE
jgi:hypothetical protein